MTTPDLVTRWLGPSRLVAAADGGARREVQHVAGHHFRVRLRACAEGGYVVSLPALPHCQAHGATLAQARARARGMIRRHLRALPRR